MLRSLSWFLTLLILSSLVFLSDSSVYPHCSHDLKYDYLSAVSPTFYFHHRPFSVLLIHPPLEPLPLPQVPSFPWSSCPSRWPHCLSDNLLSPLVHCIPHPVGCHWPCEFYFPGSSGACPVSDNHSADSCPGYHCLLLGWISFSAHYHLLHWVTVNPFFAWEPRDQLLRLQIRSFHSLV